VTRRYTVEPFAYLFAGVTLLFTTALLVSLIIDPQPVAIAAGTVIGWFWFNVLRSPYEARIDHGSVTFVGLGRRVTAPIGSIRRVVGLGYNSGFVVEGTGMKVWFRVPLRETFDFLTALREANPAIEISRM
jgi:pheromone shutdown protein TraB